MTRETKYNMFIDCEVFYTVCKESGEVKKYTSIGSLYSFNNYLDKVK